MSKNQLNVDEVVAFFGGVAELVRQSALFLPDNPISQAAVYKWKSRGSIPVSQLAKLAQLANAQGRDFNINLLINNKNMEQTMIANNNRVVIFDTTLRDGEQSPGAAMTREEKVRVARQLEKLGVDIMEAGFAAASPGDFAAIAEIASVIQHSTVCSLARATENDVRRAGEAIAAANRRRIHTFIATSPIHMEHKLKMQPDKVVQAAIAAIKLAKEYTDDIEFSCEDATRSDLGFLAEICSAAIEAGATTINIPDTVGYSVPSVTERFFRELITRTKGGNSVIWSAHCHNDLGLAVSNSLAAVQGGARQIECTINGLGERAGNASLEEIVMALKTRHDVFGLETGIDTKQIVPASKLVSTITGYPVQPNKAIVGANAFAHESGIHQDGVLKCRETYEIMSAESVGWATNRLSLGKLSGRNAFRTKLAEIGIKLESEEALNAAFARFKELADKKREIFDEDLHALVSDEMAGRTADDYKYISLKCRIETGEMPNVQLVFAKDGKEYKCESDGSGAVDAAFKAIESVVESGAELLLYSVNAVTAGSESQGEVTVRLSKDGRIVNGQGADTDIIAASAKAYLSALNKLKQSVAKLKAQGV